jgi:hypothetical protein
MITQTITPSLAAVIRSQAAAIAADPASLPTMAAAFTLGQEITLDLATVRLFHGWLASQLALIPVAVEFVSREVPLAEAVAAIHAGQTIPVSSLGTAPVVGLMTANQNLMFRAVHDHMHACLGVDDTWEGEIATTLGHLNTAPFQLWPIICSEVTGQAAVAIFEGEFPAQRLSAGCIHALSLG